MRQVMGAEVRLAERSNPREIFIPTMAMIPRGRRLLTKNPIRIIGEDANHFGYVQNNPINYTDPDGKNPIFSRISCGIVICPLVVTRISTSFLILTILTQPE